MSADDLIALAERVEKAEGPDRELDEAIHGYAMYEGYLPTPHYTASLDAAMTLVPEGWPFGCGSKDATDKSWAWAGPWDESPFVNAATPALALTAAALRARAAQEGDKA